MSSLLRIPKQPPPSVTQWIGYLKKALTMRRLSNYGSEDRLIRTAALFALFGGVGDSKAVEVYQQMIKLLLSYHRIKLWDKMLARIPGDKDAIARLALVIQHSEYALEPFEKASFPIEAFIDIALQLPDPRAYIDVCKGIQHRAVRTAFHKNTLEFISQKYRGVAGMLADPKYRTQITESIETIS